MAGRVRRPRDKENLLKRLLDGNPFQTYREALVFAAALGFARERREPFTDSEEPIRWELFREVDADALAAMIAAITSDEVGILSPDRIDEQITALEEYANGGLSELQELLDNHPEQRPPEVILDLILAEEGVEGPKPELDLGSIAEEFSS